MSVRPAADPRRLEEAGWALVLPAEDFLPYKALNALVEWRMRQAGKLGRVFEGADGVRPGESWDDFRNRHGGGPGPVDPSRMPYYLLLAGSPDQIPLAFQQQASVQHAVGRLHFDEWNDGLGYAEQLVRREQNGGHVLPHVTLFGPRHSEYDPVTVLFNDALLRPLSQDLQTRPEIEIALHLGQDAHRTMLETYLEGQRTALLLFAGHGLVMPPGSADQHRFQGALFTQDYPGPNRVTSQGVLPSPYFLDAGDVASSTSLEGLVALFISSYSALTPASESGPDGRLIHVAPDPFISPLAQRLLARGAAGVLGYAGRVWAHALNDLVSPLERMVMRLLAGDTLGTTRQTMDERHAASATELSRLVEEAEFGADVADEALVSSWIGRENSRNLILLGDPAARIPLNSYNS